MRASTSTLMISAALLGALCSSVAAADGVKVVYTVGPYGYEDIGSARGAWRDQCTSSAQDKGTVSSNNLKAVKPTVGEGVCVYKSLVGAETDISEDVAGSLYWGNYHDAYNKGGDSSGNSGTSEDPKDDDDSKKGGDAPSSSNTNGSNSNNNGGATHASSAGQAASPSTSSNNQNAGQGQQQQQQQQAPSSSMTVVPSSASNASWSSNTDVASANAALSSPTASLTSTGDNFGTTQSGTALNAGQTSAARRNNGPLPLFKLLAMLL